MAEWHPKASSSMSKLLSLGGTSRSARSTATGGGLGGCVDSDFGPAESCVAESCASFEFVDDGPPPKPSAPIPTSPARHLAASPAVLAAVPESNNVCSPCTSEIGSVFGLRFDPAENKMTLQLTAAASDLRSPSADSATVAATGAVAGAAPSAAGANDGSAFGAKLQRSPLTCRFPLDLHSPSGTAGRPEASPSARFAKTSEYENGSDDQLNPMVRSAKMP